MRIPLAVFSFKMFQCRARKRELGGSSDRDNFLEVKSKGIGTVPAVGGDCDPLAGFFMSISQTWSSGL